MVATTMIQQTISYNRNDGDDNDASIIAKHEGNELFKRGDMDGALAAYTRGLSLCGNRDDTRMVFLKNRAQVYLKQEMYDLALKDCTDALAIVPGDVKTLFRRAQAREHLGQLDGAFEDLQLLLSTEPTNKSASLLVRSIGQQRTILKEASSRVGVDIEKKTLAVVLDKDLPIEKRVSAANNLFVLGSQKDKVAIMVDQEFVGKKLRELVTSHVASGKPLSEKEEELRVATLRFLHRLASYSASNTASIILQLGLDTLKSVCVVNPAAVARGAISILALALPRGNSVAEASARHAAEAARTEVPTAPLVTPKFGNESAAKEASEVIISTWGANVEGWELLGERIIAFLVDAVHRDEALNPNIVSALLAPLVNAIDNEARALAFLKRGGLRALMTSAAFNLAGGIGSACPAVEVRQHIGVVVATLYERLRSSKEEEFKAECKAVLGPLIRSDEVADSIRFANAISTFLQATSDLAEFFMNTNSVLGKLIAMVDPVNECDTDQQIAAAEALACAASDKSARSTLLSEGYEYLFDCFTSDNIHIKVRATAALCKIASGSGPIPESTSKQLVEAVREALSFVMRTGDRVESVSENDPTSEAAAAATSLGRWVVEALTYLSIDGDVKETLIHDEVAMKGLFKLALRPCHSNDRGLRYGVISSLQNIANAHEAPDVEPEMKKLRKLAGQSVSQEHPKDEPPFPENRVDALVKLGATAALSALAVTDSEVAREGVSRIFLTMADKASHRGYMVQQGATKALIGLANNGNVKGMHAAAQALAKLAISTDPSLSFTGQKAAEAIKPLVRLLDADHGLQIFESLLALTNLASLNDELRTRMVKESVISRLEDLQLNEDYRIQRAAFEVHCNLMVMDSVFERFLDGGKSASKLRIWILMSGSDDFETSRAASGGLAILSSNAEVCLKIAQEKSGFTILWELLLEPENVDPEDRRTASQRAELQYRGAYILNNLVSSSTEAATLFLDNKGVEILSGALQRQLIKAENAVSLLKQVLNTLIEKKLIEPTKEADMSSLIK